MLAFSAAAMPVRAAHMFPEAHELFAPLTADPRELQYSLRLVSPISHQLLGEIAAGDYFGLVRWDLMPGVPVQWNAGGGAFGRFDLTARTNDLQVADYYGNMTLDTRIGDWSGRLMLYHTSSHLGDDYVSRYGEPVDKHAWDIVRLLISRDGPARLRTYAGYSYTVRSLPSGDRNAFQGGAEWTSRSWWKNRMNGYAAMDVQAWQRVEFKPMWTFQSGVTLRRDPQTRRAISMYGEYATGMMPHGQFYDREESHWVFGFRFYMT